MAPQARGSSTMGVKKSVVATRARSLLRRKMAASSRVAASTSTRGSTMVGRCCSTWPRSTEPSLHAQPAPCERAVSRILGLEALVVSVMVAPSGTGPRRVGTGSLRAEVTPAGPETSAALGPAHGAQADERPFLLGGRAETAVGPLALLERWHRVPHRPPRHRQPGRQQRLDRLEQVGAIPPAVHLLLAGNQIRQPLDRRPVWRATERERVEAGDDDVGREEAAPVS